MTLGKSKKSKRVLAGFIVLALASSGAALGAASLTPANAAIENGVTSVVVADGRTLGDGKNVRIPAIIKLTNGDLLAAYDYRPTNGDAPEPNSIKQKRSTDNGQTWQEETTIAEGDVQKHEGYSDPAYVYDAQQNKIFNFHVHSRDKGFFGGNAGIDDTDPNVQGVNLAVSTDNGETYTSQLVTSQVKYTDSTGAFAASGHGIQLQNQKDPSRNGRLILQFVGQGGQAGTYAYSVYSDDHGATWNKGERVGTDMDENEVVELEDGTLLLNSRMSSKAGYRITATSQDGGATWQNVKTDHSLIDSKTPGRNASIIRAYPSAPAGSAQSKVLLYSGLLANSSNPGISYSCDSGQTWNVRKKFFDGAAAYSDLVVLDENAGQYGVIFEEDFNTNGGWYEQLSFATFDMNWLGATCVKLEDTEVSGAPGQHITVPVTVTNDSETTLKAGASVTITPPQGWTVKSAALAADLPAGESTVVNVPLTLPASATGTSYFDATLSGQDAHGKSLNLRGDVRAEVKLPELLNPIDRSHYAGATADSEELHGGQYKEGPARYAIDGDASTKWHSVYSGGNAPLPHWISVQLDGTWDVTGIEYTPRQDTNLNGKVNAYKVYVTSEPFDPAKKEAGEYTEVASGNFDNTQLTKVNNWDKAARGKYVTLWIESEHSDKKALAAAVELRIGGVKPEGVVDPVPFPKTIPSVDTWKSAEGEGIGVYSFNADGTTLYYSESGFDAQAEILKEEFAQLGSENATASNSPSADADDVTIAIDATRKDLGEEGYELTIGKNGIKVTAANAKAAFWGSRTVVQLLKLSPDSLPYGSAKDIPAFPERSVTLCACEINVQPDFIDRLLNDMAYVKMNQLQLTLKMKSDKYPETANYSYYTKDDVRALVKKAQTLGIDVIPQIDSPGHMGPWIENVDVVQLAYNPADVAEGNPETDEALLDITNPEAVRFYEDLIDEYLDVFTSEYWHMGGDEYMYGTNSNGAGRTYARYPDLGAQGPQLYAEFINTINDYVKQKGKTLRIFNDGLTSQAQLDTLSKDIIIESWRPNAGAPVQAMINSGFKVLNLNQWKTYYSRSVRTSYVSWANPQDDYGKLTPLMFENSYNAVNDPDNQVLGMRLSIWPDGSDGQNEREVEAEVFDGVRNMAQMTWANSYPWANWADFRAAMDELGRPAAWNNVDWEPLADGEYAITMIDTDGDADNSETRDLRLDASNHREPDAIYYSSDVWQITRNTTDGYYQLKSKSAGKCLSMQYNAVSIPKKGGGTAAMTAYTKDLNVVTEVGSRPQLVNCVDVSANVAPYANLDAHAAARNNQKWQIEKTSHGQFLIRHALSNMILAVATGEEEHVDFGNAPEVSKYGAEANKLHAYQTRPAATDLVQLPEDMTSTLWAFTPAAEAATPELEAPAVHKMPAGNADWSENVTMGWYDDGGIRTDRTLLDTPLTIAGTTYRTGIGTHATSAVSLYTGGKCYGFTAKVGVDDTQRYTVNKDADGVNFKVFAGENVTTGSPLAESGLVKLGQEAKTLDVTIENPSQTEWITLVADKGSTDGNDHADWADAYLLCNEPYKLNYGKAEGEAETDISSSAPTLDAFATADVEEDTPGEGMVFELGEDLPEELQGDGVVTINAANGVVTLKASAAMADKGFEIPVVLKNADGSVAALGTARIAVAAVESEKPDNPEDQSETSKVNPQAKVPQEAVLTKPQPELGNSGSSAVGVAIAALMLTGLGAAALMVRRKML